MAPKLDSPQLSDYVLGMLSPEESLRVLDELERDPEASRMVDDYASLLAYAEGEGRAVFEGRLNGSPAAKPRGTGRIAGIAAGSRWVFTAAAVFALAVFVGQLVRGKSILWGDEAEYAALSSVDFKVSIRAEADDDLMVAMSLFHEGDYERSIRVLDRLMRSVPAYPFPDFVNYSLGVVHLAVAETRLGNSIRIYDRSHVTQALESLRRAAMLTASRRMAEEAHWLTAKGHLMMGDRSTGLLELEKVIDYGGKRGGEARRLKILIESDQ